MLDPEIVIKNMQIAYEQALLGLGRTSPNPTVGCVILNKNFEVISTGYHKKYGGAHAEIEALNQVQDQNQLNGAYVFVTLEPCAHQGQTGSCAQTLARLPINMVVLAHLDPNPVVSGQGEKILKNSGIKTLIFSQSYPKEPLCEKIYKLNEPFFYHIQNKKTFVALKVATSLDSQIALNSGESQWITSERSRAFAQQLRGQYDAVMVGIGTYLKDNPSLNVRSEVYSGKRNKVVLWDPDLKCLETIEESNILKTHNREEVIVVGRQEALDKLTTKPQIKILPLLLDEPSGLVKLKIELYELGIYSLFVEGGAGLFSHFLEQRAFEKLYQFISPTVIGAKGGLNWTKEWSILSLSQKIAFKRVNWILIENEALVECSY